MNAIQLPGDVCVCATADALFDELARALMVASHAAVSARGVFHLALSGGSTPEPFYMRLVIDPRYRELPWEDTHLWLVDERRVPESDDRSNYRMIHETLTAHVPIKRRNVHPMPVMSDDPAGEYERELAQTIAPDSPHAGGPATSEIRNQRSEILASTPALDFILLGMGEDGHTASLFPHSPALGERSRWVSVNDGPTVTPPARVTMTYPLLNAARQVAVLVTGPKKSATLREVAQAHAAGRPDHTRWPILGIECEDLAWYLDRPAQGDA